MKLHYIIGLQYNKRNDVVLEQAEKNKRRQACSLTRDYVFVLHAYLNHYLFAGIDLEVEAIQYHG